MYKCWLGLFLATFLLTRPSLKAESESYAFSMLSKSYAVSLLNDSFSPGLPHLAVLKRKNNLLSYAGVQTSKLLYSGYKDPYTANNRDYAKLSANLFGVDVNYTPNWDWGFNFNARSATTKLKGIQHEEMRGSEDQTVAQLNFAGHHNWAFFYGAALEHDSYRRSRTDEDGGAAIHQKHDNTPITVSGGYYSLGLFLGLGVTLFEHSEKLENKRDPSYDYQLSGSALITKLGTGWSSGERFPNLYQASYSLTHVPKQKAKSGGFYLGESLEHSFSFEMLTGAFQTGLYLSYKAVGESANFTTQETYNAKLAASYAPFTGHFVSLLLSATRIEENYTSIYQNRDLGKPVQTVISPGAMLSYGWSFL